MQKSDIVGAVVAGALVAVGGMAYVGIAAHHERQATKAASTQAFAAALRQAAKETTLPYVVLSGGGDSARILYGSAKLVVPAVYRVSVSGRTVAETELPGGSGNVFALPPAPAGTVSEWAQVQVVPHPWHATGFAALQPLNRPVGLLVGGQRLSLSLPSAAGLLHPMISDGGDEPLPVPAAVSASQPVLWSWHRKTNVSQKFVPAGQSFAINWPVWARQPVAVKFIASSPAAAQRLASALSFYPAGDPSGSDAWVTVNAAVSSQPR